ncbi:MAG: hypothetical protein A3D26_03230 [Candidatus Blackburnbacteria bacterium RIFCSPHIGHO2_02_FULL_44_20]|uniref:Glycosyl transferase family 1 domain-containing protein n=1 Tax=Candidatus Blackburnbacteria bacterium RIFCSPHIGHO2_02_FULL_44_20 TaxID=1797516 RepID=A0A1G1V832_9BACT|nr:MAG: hypothetical protein A3E16_01235 [Candidatus Blackburnbacteria bacterium RIFCSPHIGHO2_12_FULL_44_25]OGY11536.1 MAG: hypothetical protein A3D26_03230 [Candidatus Blackburnbacteria bacterium RIFCSPHIGHO2_02_FULL_44_20]OGY14093.1 MAG: hypothetical protein A3A62_01895 [Candidatus Blackburnbacteria bacterium RIFCSPLOWO2_01_FULL_44_43]
MGLEKDKDMKIAFFSFYSGHVYRGVETFVHELANRLVSLGNEVTVFQTGPALGETVYKTQVIKIPIDWSISGSTQKGASYYTGCVKTFTQEALRELNNGFDVVFPTNGKWQSLLCRIWAWRHRKKMIVSGQSGPGWDDRLNLFTFPDAFVAMTEYQAKWAQTANPFVRVDKIPNGVALEKFRTRKSLRSSKSSEPTILCVAAFVSWKRLNLAIKAVSKLNKVSLLLVGRGDQEKELRELGDELLPGRFDVIALPYAEMPDVYHKGSVFTFPTVPWESFGIAMVEAMASGLPVVATDDPIRREIVGDAGLFVDPENTEVYAKALEKALKTKWGDKPRRQAEKFSWDKIANQYDQLFRDLV